MAGVDPSLTIDPARSARAHPAALIIAAQGQVSGDPPQDWSCWSPEGAAGARESLLTLDPRGAGGVDRLVENPEPDDAAVSRRDGPSREGDGLVLGPPRGYLPRSKAPARWSVVQHQGRNLTGAAVAVTVDGRAVQAPVAASGRDRVVFGPRIAANAKDGADPRGDVVVDVDVTAASNGSHVR